MTPAFLQLAFGMVMLFGAAEVLVRGSVSLAKILRVPNLVIGMTVIAVGTSAPELIVTIQAVLAGAPGLAIGNIIGSNIANVLLILGCCCLLSPMGDPRNAHWRDGVVLMAGTAVFIALCAQGTMGLWSGLLLLVLFAGFLVSSYRLESKADAAAAGHAQEVEEMATLAWPLPAVAGVVALGLAGVVWGADLAVDASIEIARAYGVSEEIIGLTVIAFGTSLPELAASAVAAYRGQSDIAVGNVVGSNLFNILGIGGVAAVMAPLPVSDRIITVDVWVMLASTVLVLPILAGRWQPGRVAGAVFLILYGAYIAFNASEAGFMGAG